MNLQSELITDNTKYDLTESPKGINPFGEFSCCIFKKCCKKYKTGKRCKKCPDK